MLRQILSIACLALAACSPGAESSGGGSQSKTYDFKDFTSVKAEKGVALKLSQGPFAVSAEGTKSDIDHAKIELHGDELVISRNAQLQIGHTTYTVSVRAPTYKAITANAGVAVEGEDLTLDDVTVDLSAGIDARLSGTCKALTAKVSAGTSLKADELKCASATVTASAGAVADVYASESAKLSASAGAKVSVAGHPPQVDKNVEVGGVIDVKD